MRSKILLFALTLVFAASSAFGATILIVNNDGPGEGFNDTTPASPVGGNPGTTIGEQRLNVFNEAANLWGAILPSTVTIRVDSNFDPLFCDASQAVLGSAGPNTVHRNFSGAEKSGTWYHQALANRLAGFDLDGGTSDISARFNADLDNNNNCLSGTNWYYGFDGNAGGDVDLFSVVLHEIGHGLGFSTFVDESTGSEFAGFPDIFETYIYDNVVGMTWDAMSDAQRAASAVRDGELAWNGPAATAAAPLFLQGSPIVDVLAPAGIAGPITDVGTAAFGPSVASSPVTAEVVLVDDGAGVTSDGCTAISTNLSGKIALIDRGTCAFTTKVKNAQNQGAVGVIIVNNVAGGVIDLGGTDATITIPSLMISQADGDAIKAQLGAGVTASLTTDPAALAGADAAGRPLLYAPNPIEPGSSISHWDTRAFPNLLMEPFATPGLEGVDLTKYHFADIGWLGRNTGTGDAPSARSARLLGNTPNPFNPSTVISYEIGKAGPATLAIYDLAGRHVRTLISGYQEAGTRDVIWNGQDDSGRSVASGVYLYRLESAGEIVSKSMVLLK